MIFDTSSLDHIRELQFYMELKNHEHSLVEGHYLVFYNRVRKEYTFIKADYAIKKE